MYKMRAKRRFKKYFLEALLEGKKAETAADQAMTLVKSEMKAIFDTDTTLPPPKKERMWFVMLDELVDWEVMLSDLDINVACIPEILKRMDDPANTIYGPGITAESELLTGE